MFFDFAFRVPLLRNPFAAPTPQPLPPPPPIRKPERPRPIHRPEFFQQGQGADAWSDAGLQPRSVSHKRRRGWEPTESSASGGLAPPVMNRAVSRGHLSAIPPPPFGNEAAYRLDDDDEEAEDQRRALPPAKRRRVGGFTGTLLTGALNVALVGTAVGLTAFRFWRDRGKPDDSPVTEHPPPYEAGSWEPSSVSYVVDRPASPTSSATSSTAHQKKPRPTSMRSHTSRRRPAKPAFRPASPTKCAMLAPPPVEPIEDDVGMESGELDDQMDWMSAQLRNLIAEGQKALGKEIVVDIDSGRDEDLVDDGDEAWETDGGGDYQRHRRTQSSRAGSIRSYANPTASSLKRSSSARRASVVGPSANIASLKRPYSNSFTFPPRPPSHAGLSHSTSSNSSHSGVRPSTPTERMPIRPLEGLYTSPLKGGANFDDDGAMGGREASPDLRVAMERVRRAYGLGR